MKALSVAELIELDAHDLERYFNRHASFNSRAPHGRGLSYFIRVGARAIFDDDTRELRIKFEKAVADAKGPDLPANTGPPQV